MATLQTEPLPTRSSPPAVPPASHGKPTTAPPRLVSLDAYRGFIMIMMASAGLSFSQVAHNLDGAALAGTSVLLSGSPTAGPLQAVTNLFPDRTEVAPFSPLWSFLGYQTDHAAWVGCSFWDLIQPSFMFMVGVALPYSVASRRARGDGPRKLFAHAVWRALLLVLLAVFLSSPMRLPREMEGYAGPRTNWLFTNVLAQIGLGYVFVFLLEGKGWKVQLLALAGILVGYTLFFGLYPLPPEGFDYKAVGVPDGWPHLTGWFAHWDKNTNAASAFDVWFLNLFPRPVPFKFEPGGYQTLNFVPSLATMILGLMAGEMLRGPRGVGGKFVTLVLAGLACLAAGWLMGQYVCPLVKRIWTPSWAVFSAGWTFLILAGFFGVIDVLGWKRWTFPLVVVGMNSIAMYLMSMQMKPWIRSAATTHLGRDLFAGDFGPVWMMVTVLGTLWLICLWLYRQKIFLRI